DSLGLEPERPDAELFSALEDGVPDVLAVGAGKVQLVSELADEADPKNEAGDPGNASVLRVQIAERLVRDVQVRQPLHQLACTRAGDVHGRQGAGHVDHPDV